MCLSFVCRVWDVLNCWRNLGHALGGFRCWVMLVSMGWLSFSCDSIINFGVLGKS